MISDAHKYKKNVSSWHVRFAVPLAEIIDFTYHNLFLNTAWLPWPLAFHILHYGVNNK
jgi:hypothetical protein